MSDRIVKNVPFFGKNPKNMKIKNVISKRYINKRRIVKVGGIRLAINFTESDFNNAYDRFYLKEKNIIEPINASAFIENSIYGKITQ